MAETVEESETPSGEKSRTPELYSGQFSLLWLLLLALAVPVSVQWVPRMSLFAVAAVATAGLLVNIVINVWKRHNMPRRFPGDRVVGALLGFSAGFFCFALAVLLVVLLPMPAVLDFGVVLSIWKGFAAVCGWAGFVWPALAIRRRWR